ncbi:adenylate/guanylate cyclase domain-containing protein [Roseobacter weihaiensis]|uniref:adenylate/guanylate cyclase domain-containing protein n=1 Tax=Roseobacter weihaiensis TaxID=2763262 RepID=UPI001D0BAB41|nr:adenylate/guanylate cyclase domain-containing protein [Roseobacter sp. H9]
MSDTTPADYAEESAARLLRAEQNGLRLAIACRTLVVGAAFIWYVAAPFLFSDFEPRLAVIFILLAFTAVGVAHLKIIGTGLDRWWMKYAVYALDTLAICATFVLIPISRAEDVPQIIAFRAYGIYYLFPILAVSCLSLSWRLVIWVGCMCVFGWWAAFLWVSAQMDRTLSWADIPAQATRQDYESIFLSIDFIGRGNRIEESAMLLFAALGLAVAVYRARGVFFAQVASELDWRRERAAREHISDLLGKYVPEEIAQKLIADAAPLKPQRSIGAALVMDIAGFTRYSARHDPEHVIGALNAFLADATQAVSGAGGIVITYLGDGFLVTFNAPVKIDDPSQAALRAASFLRQTARTHRFEIRIGIATGELVTGIIGNDARQSFTVYGDAVNLASRLEGLCKQAGVDVLTDEATYNAVRGTMSLRRIGAFDIRGFSAQTSVFAPAQQGAAETDRKSAALEG